MSYNKYAKIGWAALAIALACPLVGRGGDSATDRLAERLRTIRFEEFAIEKAQVKDVVAYIRQKSKTLDPDNEGVNILLLCTPERKTRKISMNLTALPLGAMLRYICMASDLEMRFERHAVVLFDEETAPDLEPMVTRIYSVSPSILKSRRTKKKQSFED